MPQGKLNGKTALVTGASSGIGEAIATALATEGASVALVARRQERLTRLAQQITSNGGQAIPIAADVTDDAQAHNAVFKAHNHWGQLDILVNSAGVALLGPIDSAPTEDWRRMVNLNVLGMMYTTHAALPLMTQQGSGHLVNVAAIGGRYVRANIGVYCATKSAIITFSEAVRLENLKNNIRVTVMEPGMVKGTELHEHITNAETRKEIDAWEQSIAPLQSVHVAAGVLYALTQPPEVSVNEIVVRPTEQDL